MAKGNKNRGRGGYRGESNGGQFRGRGGGTPRGGRGGRGRGGRGRGGYIPLDEFDLPIQQWPANQPPATPPPRGGRPRGNLLPFNVYSNTRGGLGSPRGRGTGRGNVIDPRAKTFGQGRNLAGKLNAGAPLSKLLYEDRPFLRPIKFVRSVHTATLFQKEDEIFQPVVESAVDGVEVSHVPTAEAVLRVFNPNEQDEASEDEEALEEIDFADMGRFQAQVDAAATQPGISLPNVTSGKGPSDGFFIDTTPSATHSNGREDIHAARLDNALGSATVNDADDDEEVIVYVAPHPRRSAAPAAVQAKAPLRTTSILTGLEIGSSTKGPHDSLSSSVEAAPAILQDQPVPPTTVSETNHASFDIELGTLYPEPKSALHQSAPDATSLPPPPSFDNVSFTLTKSEKKKQTRRIHPAHTPRSLLKHKRQARRKSARGFGAFGAMHEEALLHQEDPRRAERRRGDSDVDWGTSDEEVDALSGDMGGMELDGDIGLDAMKSFAYSMSAEGSRHVTMDDIADTERMRQEDEEEVARGMDSASSEGSLNGMEEPRQDSDRDGESDELSDEEVEQVVRTEENKLVGDDVGPPSPPGSGAVYRGVRDDEGGDNSEDGSTEADDDDDSDEDSEDDDETPRRGFKARLERIRSRPSQSKAKARAENDSSDEAMSVQMTWADEDEEWIQEMEDIIAENQLILSGSGSRKARKYMFKAIQNGDFGPYDEVLGSMLQPARRRKDKGKDLPPELLQQWEKDRQKKAENKQKRAEERRRLAADPLEKHKGGKKGRKDMLAVVRSAEDLPNRIVDLVSLEKQIRRFLQDISRTTMSLPPAEKETRATVHELALAFNLKSQSKGKGKGRYTTLTKTTRSGVGISEGKIRAIMRRATGAGWEGPSGRGKGRADNLSKHREGEEVGKGAAKIDGKNIGFKMLAAMGWADGERIGLTNPGLDAPLTAIMKKTKLGLGATMSQLE